MLRKKEKGPQIGVLKLFRHVLVLAPGPIRLDFFPGSESVSEFFSTFADKGQIPEVFRYF